MSAADVQQEDVVAAAIVANATTPLGRPLVVPHTLARGDQVAAGPGDAVQQPRLAVERDRGRLVEPAHTLVQLAIADERAPLKAQPEHLQLGGVESAS